MTLEELNQLLTARGIASKVHIDGVSRAGLLDNVWVVGREGARWILKWHERGESEEVASYSTESDVATAVLQRLSQSSPGGAGDRHDQPSSTNVQGSSWISIKPE